MGSRTRNIAGFGQYPENVRPSLTASFGYIEFDEPMIGGIGESNGEFNGDLKFFFEDISKKNVPVDIRMIESLKDAEQEQGFETSIIMSYFSNRRANVDDILPDNSGYKGGWVGDEILNDLYVENLVLGSRLWLLSRSKMNNQLLIDAREFCLESLQWMLDFNITDKIIITTERADIEHISIDTKIYRPENKNLNYRYFYNWIAQTFYRD
jgi:phage gp46-like protein